MKRKIKMLLAILAVGTLLCLTFCSCGSSGGKNGTYTIHCKNGGQETFSYDELFQIQNNELAFNEKYSGAYIEGEAPIYSIEIQNRFPDLVDVSVGKGGLKIISVPKEVALQYNVGDTFPVKGKVQGGVPISIYGYDYY